jgi:lysozyme
MTLSEAGISRIKRYESVRLKVYEDEAGLKTIGVGHLITPEEERSGKFASGVITMAQCDELLEADSANAQWAVNHLVRMPLTQDQFDSLVSFVFNVGVGAFQNSSLLKALNAGASAEDIRNDFKKWNKVTVNGVLVVSEGLTGRREDESSYWKG